MTHRHAVKLAESIHKQIQAQEQQLDEMLDRSRPPVDVEPAAPEFDVEVEAIEEDE